MYSFLKVEMIQVQLIKKNEEKFRVSLTSVKIAVSNIFVCNSGMDFNY